MTAPATPHCVCQLNRARVAWVEEELMVATLAGGVLLTDLVDQLPPNRAQIVVALCLLAGGRLERGDETLFTLAAEEARLRGVDAAGWWREALGEPAPARRPGKATNMRRR